MQHVQALRESPDTPEPPHVEHEELVIRFPNRRTEDSFRAIEKRGWKLYFDGRCAKEKGSGGFIAFDEHGNVLGGAAINYHGRCKTNNAAGLEALHDALLWLKD